MLLALKNIKKVGEVVDRPKALGDIRGVTYIYGVFYRFGLIDVPDDAKEKMGHPQNLLRSGVGISFLFTYTDGSEHFAVGHSTPHPFLLHIKFMTLKRGKTKQGQITDNLAFLYIFKTVKQNFHEKIL